MERFDFSGDGAPPIPVCALTGFLGSGKTTLLNRILNGDHGLRVAVMVNDFGAVNIDQALVVGLEERAISLANGCICCEINDDLAAAVTDLLAMPAKPEYILIEASGVADPSGVALTFAMPNFRGQVRLDTVISMVDAENLFAQPELQSLKLRQIAFSDLVILNKVDLVDEATLAKVKGWIGGRFGSIRMIEASFGDAPLEILLSVGRFDPDKLQTEQKPRHHAHRRFAACSYATDQIFAMTKLRRALSRLPPNVYRVKGIIAVDKAPDRRAVLQVVGRRVDISLAEPWNQEPPRSQIVAIGAPDGLDEAFLRTQFEACLQKQPPT